jgi:hypothetical protein
MRIQLGIVGLLVVLFIILGMTRPLSAEGYTDASAPSSTITVAIVLILLFFFFPALFALRSVFH